MKIQTVHIHIHTHTPIPFIFVKKKEKKEKTITARYIDLHCPDLLGKRARSSFSYSQMLLRYPESPSTALSLENFGILASTWLFANSTELVFIGNGKIFEFHLYLVILTTY